MIGRPEGNPSQMSNRVSMEMGRIRWRRRITHVACALNFLRVVERQRYRDRGSSAAPRGPTLIVVVVQGKRGCGVLRSVVRWRHQIKQPA